MFTLIATIVLAILSALDPTSTPPPPTEPTVAQSAPAYVPPAPEPRPPCIGQAILITVDWDADCDVRPPQTLNVRMDLGTDPRSPSTLEWCGNRGGEVMADSVSGLVYCLHIDY